MRDPKESHGKYYKYHGSTMGDTWEALQTPNPWESHGSFMRALQTPGRPMGVSWATTLNPWKFHGRPMGTLQSHGRPVNPWWTHGVPMRVPWDRSAVPLDFHASPMGLLCYHGSMGLPWDFHVILMLPWVTHGTPIGL